MKRLLLLIALMCAPAGAQSFSGQSAGDIFVAPPYRACWGTDNGQAVCVTQTGNQLVRITGQWDAQVPTKIVSTLGSVTANNGRIYRVTDGTSTSDCTVGGGSTTVLCFSNGSSWSAIVGASSGVAYPFVGPRPWTDVTNNAYGADPTNATDSTTAIQSAITAACTNSSVLFFPPGRYKVSQPQTGSSSPSPVFSIPTNCHLDIEGSGNSGGNPGNPPQAQIGVISGASPSAGPVFLVSGANVAGFVTFKNLLMTCYNQCIYLQGTNTQDISSVAMVNLSLNTQVTGLSDNTPLKMSQVQNISWQGGVLNTNNTSNDDVLIIGADTGGTETECSSFIYFDGTGGGFWAGGGVHVDQRTTPCGSGGPGPMVFRNILVETATVPIFRITNTGSSSSFTTFNDLTLDNFVDADAPTNPVVSLNASTVTLSGLHMVSSTGSASNAVQITAGAVQDCDIRSQAKNGTLVTNGSGAAVGPCTIQGPHGNVVIANTSDSTRLQSNTSQVQSGSMLAGIANGNSFMSLNFDPINGAMFNYNGANYGYDAQVYQTARESLGVGLASLLPPTGVTGTATTGGSLGNGSYYYYIASTNTASNCNGATLSAASIASNVVLLSGANNAISLTWTAPVPSTPVTAAGYCVARIASATVFPPGQGTVAANYFTASTSFTDTGAAGISGAVPTSVSPMSSVYSFLSTGITGPSFSGPQPRQVITGWNTSTGASLYGLQQQCSNPSSGTITSPYTVAGVSGASSGDFACILYVSNGTTITVPDAASTGFTNGFDFSIVNNGTTPITVTRQTSSTFSVNGGSAVTSFNVVPTQSVYISQQGNGTNWLVSTSVGLGQGAAPVVAWYLSPQCLPTNTNQCFFTPANTQVDNTASWATTGPTVTITDNAFQASDVGKRVAGYIVTAGAGGPGCLPDRITFAPLTTGVVTIATFVDSNHVTLTANPSNNAGSAACFIWGTPDDSAASALETAYSAAIGYCPRVMLASANYWFSSPHFYTQPTGCLNLPSLTGSSTQFGNLDLAQGFELEGRGPGATQLYLGPDFPNGDTCAHTSGNSPGGCFAIPLMGKWKDFGISGGAQSACQVPTGKNLIVMNVATMENLTLTNMCFGISGNVRTGIYADQLSQLYHINNSGFGEQCMTVDANGAVQAFKLYCESNTKGSVATNTVSPAAVVYTFQCFGCLMSGAPEAWTVGSNVIQIGQGSIQRYYGLFLSPSPVGTFVSSSGTNLFTNLGGKLYCDSCMQIVGNASAQPLTGLSDQAAGAVDYFINSTIDGAGASKVINQGTFGVFVDQGGNTLHLTDGNGSVLNGTFVGEANSANSVGVTAAKLVLSAGWGSTASVAVASPAGGDFPIQFTITNSGTGQAASPTITYTFPTVLPVAPITCTATQIGGNNATGTFTSSSLLTTGATFTFSLTPTASDTEIVKVTCETS